MKKNLFGIIAIVIAIALSAFTMDKKIETPKLSDPYWYNYDPGTDHLTGFIGQLSQATLISTTNCKNHASQPVCAKGYTNSLTGSFPMIPPSGGQDVLKKVP